LAFNMGDGVEEVGGEEGGDKVPVVDKGEGRNMTGADGCYGAIG
jgi:hypothetical protein